MFAKLLKYEWRATRGFLGLLSLICLSAALVGGLAMRYLVWVSELDTQEDVAIVLSVLTMIFAFIAIAIGAAAMQFFTLWRFYKSRFTDEGYLTFTLPVTTHQILLSSFVNCLLGVLSSLVALGISYLVLLLLGFSALDNFFPSLWEVLPLAMENLWRLFSGETGTFLGLFLLEIVTGTFSGVLTMMLSVTIGCILAKRHKVVVSVAVYFGISMAISMITSVLGAIQGIVSYTSQAASGISTLSGMMLSGSVLAVVVAIGAYWLMYVLVHRKLNLT